MAFSKTFDLHGHTALITGASSGLGAAIAVALADAGANIRLHYSSAFDGGTDDVETTAARIREPGREVTPIDADLQKDGAAARIREAAGEVDILVVNASVQADLPLHEIRAEDIDREYRVNFRTTVELLQLFVPGMAARGWGRVLSIGSVQQARPLAQNLTYAAMKAAQETLMRGLAVQHGRDGVLFNTLSPGIIATERNRKFWEADPDWAARRAAANLVGRVSDPEDYVGSALLLCSDAARFITGTNLYATGGAHLPVPPD